VRKRTLAVLLAITTTGALVPATAGHAAGPVSVTISCDGSTGSIRATATGTASRGSRILDTSFRVVSGSYATAAGTGFTPREVTTVGTKVAPSGGFTASFDRPWPAGGYLFFDDVVEVTVVDRLSGALIGTGRGSCTFDNRTTLTVDCDQEAGTGHVHASAIGFPASPVEVRYYTTESWSQPNANDPGFTNVTKTLRRSLTVTPMADGTWADSGYTYPQPSTAYYAGANWAVEIWTVGPNSNHLIGHGAGVCVLRDERPNNGTAN
jgi:hypothetical protein